ncbi:MAG: PadR family transcriptional regulator [Gemmatimonadota bacterium]|jgi:DNA-binding PadR family transcriptional regulator
MTRTNLTFPTGLVLQAIAAGDCYGFDIIEATGLPSGTVYPALRRLEGAGFLSSKWEEEKDVDGRPARCYYALTPEGSALLHRIVQRFPAIPSSLAGHPQGGSGTPAPDSGGLAKESAGLTVTEPERA